MLRPRQAEKATSLGEDVAELEEPTAFPDDVEQIAVLASRRIGPLASGTLPRTRPRSRINIDRPGVLWTSPTIQYRPARRSLER